MFVQICKLGENESLHTFAQGRHEIGRGPILQCNDKRVSRSHALLEITQDEIKLTSIHVNPCFVRFANSKTITILKKESSSCLNDGDVIAFLPDDVWFKIQVVEHTDFDTPKVEAMEVTDGSLKRPLNSTDESDEASAEKQLKIIESDTLAGGSEAADTINESIHLFEVEIKEEIEIKDGELASSAAEIQNNTDKDEAVNNSPSDQPQSSSTNGEMAPHLSANTNNADKDDAVNDSPSDQPQSSSTNGEMTPHVAANPNNADKDEAVNDSPSDQPQTSSTGPSIPNPKKERCWYGAACYRKNPVHHREYTHPGDSDYDSDPNDNRPVCSFGAACYRKNTDHRRHYKHPSNQPSSKQKRKRNKVKRLNAADPQEMEELDFSESDEDPFIDDGDTDEYSADSVSDDSDWEPRDGADEDGENIKRLVKEAKRFVKQ